MKFWEWYKKSSTYVGIPVFAIILVSMIIWSAQKVIFTTTCLTVEWRCEYSLGVSQALAAIQNGEDIVIPPPAKRKQ